MAEKGWHTITLPDSLLNEVQRVIERDAMGYKTKSEFIKEGWFDFKLAFFMPYT